MRYIYYFEAVLRGVIKIPVIKKLKAIVFNTVPKITAEGCRPYYELAMGKDFNMVSTNRSEYLPFYYHNKDYAMHFQFGEGEEPILMGDVHFNFKHQGVMYDTSFCRISFNTSFIS